MSLTELLEIIEKLRSYPADTRWCAMRLIAVANCIDLGMLAHLATIYEEIEPWEI